jgi:hypothetical protein
MANKVSKSKSAVRAAREAVKASQKEMLERAACNADDLAVFFSSRERLDEVDEWLETKTAGLKQQAERKRTEYRRAAGQAVIALRDRGQTLRDITGLTGVSMKALRELIRVAGSGTVAASRAAGETLGNATDADSVARTSTAPSQRRETLRPVGSEV